MKKCTVIALSVVLFLALIPAVAAGQQDDEIFKARVLDILEEKTITDEMGESITLQRLKLRGLEGTWKGMEIEFDGTEYEVMSANEYEAGDKVMVAASRDAEGNDVFYVTDHVRQGSLYWLAAIFATVVVAIGRLKGMRAIAVLVASFFIILKFIIPLILDGKSPLLISIIGSVFILVIAIYITEGFKRSSTVAIGAITVSLLITGFLSVWFTKLARLTGYANDDVFFLKSSLGSGINVEGLLLAGIIIGALGVLDDVVVAQIETVNQLTGANPSLKKRELYARAMKVGVTHMSAMVNTLFLAYAGASLPLLILFSNRLEVTFSQALNNELIATEIVRTVAGSIGLILAVPLATLLAVHFIRSKKMKVKTAPEIASQ
ncbi:MAG: YibE/F family protein [Patescibacteria group bacterium]